jgi:hypothetical protein
VIEDGELGGVKPTERDGPEGDGPYIVGDFFESDVFASEEMADVDPCGVPADASVGGDFSHLEVSGVFRREQLGREGSRGGLIDRSGGLVGERLVGSNLVEVDPPRVEAALLCAKIASGRDGGVGLEIPVHTFVSAVLLG